MHVTSSDAPPSTPPVLAIVNARVWTNDPRRPWADALLVRDGVILAVGSSAELRKRAGVGARLLDARGLVLRPAQVDRSLVPGAPANVRLVEIAPSDPPASGGTVVLEVVGGHIVFDRDDLSR